MSRKRVLILIPARFASTRFPGKPLAMIANESMISRVLKNAQSCHHENIEFQSFVVTDDQKIEDHVKTFSPHVLRVDDDVPSGTLRIDLAYKRFFQAKGDHFDLIINVQGDEPLLQGSELIKLAQFHLTSTFDVSTLVKKQLGFGDMFLDSNKVKVALSETTKQAFYFSRASIPFKRDQEQSNNDFWYFHIGVYSYKPTALDQFSHAPMSRLEDLEKLEQLRALEIGLSIGTVTTESVLMGVDHPDDIKKVEEVIYGRK